MAAPAGVVKAIPALYCPVVVAARHRSTIARLSTAGAGAGVLRAELAVLSATTPLSVGLVVAAFASWWRSPASLGPLPSSPMTPVALAAGAVVLAMGPLAAFAHARDRRTRLIEDRFPDFLRDLNESNRAGMTMAQAVRVVARGDYGRLTPEVRRMADQVSWGVAFEEAFRLLGERVGTPVVTRAIALVTKATRAGGNVADVLAAAARDTREIHALDRERRSNMTLYVIIVYLASGVFLGVIAALQGLLIPSVLSATGDAGGSLGGISVGGSIDLQEFRFAFFGIGLVQALGSGLVAGVMSEGSVAAGMKHATILTAVSALVLGVV